MSHISQREARRTKKELFQLKQRLSQQMNAWSSEYPGGVHLTTFTPPDEVRTIVNTARKLGRAVVVVQDETYVRYYACEVVR